MSQAHCSATAPTCQKDMWLNQGPGTSVVDQIYYSANFYTDFAIDLIEKRDKAKDFYLHLTYQSVHAPWQDPPEWEQIPKDAVPDRWWDRTWGSSAHNLLSISLAQTLRKSIFSSETSDMACVSQTVLNAVDNGLGNLTKTLRAEGMWDSTLMVLTADNGGSCGIANHPASGPNIPTKGGEPPPEPGSWTEPANNYPLRGRKCTPYDGGTRTTAFISGGFIPTALRGTESHVLMHVADCTTLELLGFSRYEEVSSDVESVAARVRDAGDHCGRGSA